MTNSLLALEQSLYRARKTHQKVKSMRVLTPEKLQQQIDVVQGKRVGRPSSELRSLENRLLARSSSREPMTSQLETQRLDHGQAPMARMPEVAPLAFAKAVASPAINASDRAHSSQSYIPEFSAPDTGRFHVEPFSDGENSEDLFDQPAVISQPDTPKTPAPNINSQQPLPTSTPVLEEPSFHQTEKPPVAGDTSSPSLPPLDDESWIQQAQEDQPQSISESSRNSLNASATLAKEDFDRDLAAILGSDPKPQQSEASPQTEPLQNTPLPQSTEEPDSNTPALHPNHDIFDQMGLGMQYANSFDLGDVNLQERFDQYDQELAQAQVKETVNSDAQSIQSPFVDPMALDDFDLVAELAEISEEYPQVATAVCTPEKQPEPVPVQDATEQQAQDAVIHKPSQPVPVTEQEQRTENNHVDEDNHRVGEHHE